MQLVAMRSLSELQQRYLALAERTYRRRSGEPSREHLNIRASLDRFVRFAGADSPADRVNRHQVRAWVDQLAAEGLSRSYVNQCLQRVRRWIAWAADLDLIPMSVTEDLRRVMPLRAYRSPAREPDPPPPPPLDRVAMIPPHLPPMARDVLLLVRLTGARPSEILALRNAEVLVDEHGPRLTPAQHKTAHHGHARIIPLSAAALAIVERWWRPLLPEDRLFATRLSRSGHYSIDAFRAVIRRACRRAGVPAFTPYGVRRAVARKVRRDRGLDAAQALLGHASARTTEVYAPLTARDAAALTAARRATEVL